MLPLLVACAGMGASTGQLRSRASFDLGCPGEAIEIVPIDAQTRGVRGCGGQATYVELCRPCANGYAACECTWVLNTDARTKPSR